MPASEDVRLSLSASTFHCEYHETECYLLHCPKAEVIKTFWTILKRNTWELSFRPVNSIASTFQMKWTVVKNDQNGETDQHWENFLREIEWSESVMVDWTFCLCLALTIIWDDSPSEIATQKFETPRFEGQLWNRKKTVDLNAQFWWAARIWAKTELTAPPTSYSIVVRFWFWRNWEFAKKSEHPGKIGVRRQKNVPNLDP
jgi:hypothetical protein